MWLNMYDAYVLVEYVMWGALIWDKSLQLNKIYNQKQHWKGFYLALKTIYTDHQGMHFLMCSH